MPKEKENPYIKLDRSIFHKDCDLSFRAKWLYTVLSELEHRYTGKKTNFFFRPQKELSKDSGMSIASNRKYRGELIKAGYLEIWQMHWVDKDESFSEKHVTAYRLLQ